METVRLDGDDGADGVEPPKHPLVVCISMLRRHMTLSGKKKKRKRDRISYDIYSRHINRIQHINRITLYRDDSGDPTDPAQRHRHCLHRLRRTSENDSHSAVEGWQIHGRGDVVRTGTGHLGGWRLRVPWYPLRDAAGRQPSLAIGRVLEPYRALLERHLPGAQLLRELLAA